MSAANCYQCDKPIKIIYSWQGEGMLNRVLVCRECARKIYQADPIRFDEKGMAEVHYIYPEDK